MKVGDLVRVVAVPARLPKDSPDTKLVFERSVGHIFPIIDITADGQVELEVGEVMGVLACLHSIWIESECLELVQKRDKDEK
jgi:hypothetical protein